MSTIITYKEKSIENKMTEKTTTEKLYKIVVIGDMGVGKTALIRKYVQGFYSENYKATIGVDFASKDVIKDGIKYRLQLWDIAGQERFGNMSRIYVKDALGAIVVADVTRNQTINAAIKWKQNLDCYTSDRGVKIPSILIINKSDLKSPTHVYPKQMNIICEEAGFSSGKEISVKYDKEEIDNIFLELIELIKNQPLIIEPQIVKIDLNHVPKEVPVDKCTC